MDIRVLGPLEVLTDQRMVRLGGPKQRTVLALLALRANEVVSAERLIDDVWGENPPEAAKSSLQSYVSHLRTALGSGRIEGRSAGYVLHAASDEIDAVRFAALVEEGNRASADDPAAAIRAYHAALGFWRGGALDDLAGTRSLQPEIARLEELRMAAVEQRLAAELALGRHAEVVAELETLIGRSPLRERLWGHLMVALYRSGRQADALAAYQRARQILSEELGIDPSTDLQRLQEQILRQDLAHGPLSPDRAVTVVDQIALALAAAHRQGVIHRDVKPANILFDEEGNAYLSDFGIAKDLAAARGTSTDRSTPSRFAYYISPEEARGDPPTHLGDVYSLGLVMYELLAGRHPFAETPPEKLF